MTNHSYWRYVQKINSEKTEFTNPEDKIYFEDATINPSASKIYFQEKIDDYYINYLRELKMILHFLPLSNKNIRRSVELCQKTNQCNTTTIRYTSEELKSKGKVIVIGLESQNTEFENIGLFVIEQDKNSATLENYIMSCRMLGRTLEKTCIAWCINYANKLNYEYLNAKLIKNRKNIPVHNLYNEMKFEYKDNNTWSIPTKNYKFENKIIEIKDHTLITEPT